MKNKDIFEFTSEAPRFLGRPSFESSPLQQMFNKLMDSKLAAEFNKKDVEKANKSTA